MPQDHYEKELQTWIDQKKSALELSLTASKLSYERAVDLVLQKKIGG